MDTGTNTRQRIIDSARDLIHARSYSEVGVQEICDQAGVRKGSFYHFFPSKRDLMLAVIDEFHTFFREDILAKAFDKDIPPLQRIDRFFEFAYAFHSQMKETTGHMLGCPFGNIASEMSTQDDVIRTKVDTIFVDAELPFKEILMEAMARGDLPPTDPDAAARAMFAYTEGIMLYAKTRNDPELIRDLGTRALRLAMPAFNG
jgi:TetR/AcrR family transcriptional repressor of nem operon